MRGRRQQTKRRLKSEFVFFFSVFITIIPTHWLCQMWANSSVAEFLHCENATQVRLRVYLGVNTCEVFLCFQAIIFLGSIALSSQWLLCIHCLRHSWVPQVSTPRVSSERERKFRRGLFTSSMKCKIWHFHVVVVQYKKGVAHVQCCCFALLFWLSCRRHLA